MNLYKIIEKKLYYLGYSENTIKSYLSVVYNFECATNKHWSRLNSKDFQDYLDSQSFSSISQQNIVISALKFAWEKALGKKYLKINFTRPKKERKLPRVIDADFVNEVINNIQNLKHKTMMAIMFECALRRSELINLKLSNIDRKRKLLLIENAKGNKDRYVPISDDLIQLIIKYYRKFRPKVYLFNGQSKLKYSFTSLNNLVKDFFGSEFSCHTLRHSGTTAMHEQGVDLATLSKLLGHNSIKTTEIYTHVSLRTIQNIKSPLRLSYGC